MSTNADQRRAVARHLYEAEELRTEDAAPNENLPRFALVIQYADAGRGIQHGVEFGEDPVAMLHKIRGVTWDGWLPRSLHDLDTGAKHPVRIAYTAEPFDLAAQDVAT